MKFFFSLLHFSFAVLLFKPKIKCSYTWHCKCTIICFQQFFIEVICVPSTYSIFFEQNNSMEFHCARVRHWKNLANGKIVEIADKKIADYKIPSRRKEKQQLAAFISWIRKTNTQTDRNQFSNQHWKSIAWEYPHTNKNNQKQEKERKKISQF